jgi:hypothetical protein
LLCHIEFAKYLSVQKEQTLAIWREKEQQFEQQQEIETELSLNIQSFQDCETPLLKMVKKINSQVR